MNLPFNPPPLFDVLFLIIDSANQPVQPIYTSANDFTENLATAVCEGLPLVYDDVIQAKVTSDDPKKPTVQQHRKFLFRYR